MNNVTFMLLPLHVCQYLFRKKYMLQYLLLFYVVVKKNLDLVIIDLSEVERKYIIFW